MVVAIGPYIEVSINEHSLASITDDAFSEGSFALAIRGLNTTVKFDNFTLYSIP